MSRILVVDDEPSIRAFLHSVLIEAGHAVATAANGEEALDLPGTFDLLLTDVLMPRMTGDELARQIRGRDPNVKVLYLTAYSDRLFEAKVALDANEAVLEKPAPADMIRETIDLLLNDEYGAPADA